MQRPKAGDRVKLIHTSDPYTNMKKGDTGTVRYLDSDPWNTIYVIKWDDGSNSDMLEGIDLIEIVD
jgi:uncharacterized protein DUF4314